MFNLTQQDLIQRIDEGIAETEFENAVVLLHIENGEYYNFNSTGSELWKALQSPRSLDELILLLTARYECTVEQCRKDILLWLKESYEKGLIKVVNDK